MGPIFIIIITTNICWFELNLAKNIIRNNGRWLISIFIFEVYLNGFIWILLLCVVAGHMIWNLVNIFKDQECCITGNLFYFFLHRILLNNYNGLSLAATKYDKEVYEVL